MDIRGPSNDKPYAGDMSDVRQRQAKVGSVNDGNGNSQSASQVAARHTPSPAMIRLAAKLEGIPEVRDDVVARVSQQLDTGYYLTKDAAAKTAEVLGAT